MLLFNTPPHFVEVRNRLLLVHTREMAGVWQYVVTNNTYRCPQRDDVTYCEGTARGTKQEAVEAARRHAQSVLCTDQCP
jgi:hypothetical protein